MKVLLAFSVVTLCALAFVETQNDYPKLIESICSREEDDDKPGEDIEVYWVKELRKKMKKDISCLEIENIKSREQFNKDIAYLKEANQKFQEQLKEISSLKKEIENSRNQLIKENNFLKEENEKYKEQIEDSTIINGPGDKEDTVNIFEATKKGSLQAVVYYIKQDPLNINKKEHGDKGDTPLIKASWKGYLKIVRYLISKGAGIDITSSKGYTALILAASWGHTSVVRYLIEKDANLNIQDDEGETALHSAVKLKHFDVVKLLIEKGADKNLKDKDGRTPLDSAKFNGLTAIVNLLS